MTVASPTPGQGRPPQELDRQVLGTPNYMPPEQADGRVAAVGTLSDVNSLGAILYCMLTGRPPFQSSSPFETLMQVIKEPPIAPRQLIPSLPRDLETICLKAIEKSPAKRYASAAEMREGLNRYLAGEPILARIKSLAAPTIRQSSEFNYT